ncbi:MULTISPECIES: type II toxin-antitoxin system HicB family antitoxin [unclassified Marinovum]|uniref:type II toxin-antitoxin system HicB family antitoxin n=1 Tax=unclassified Marinovum TaxID=2647166 RepID=UPI003EDBF448
MVEYAIVVVPLDPDEGGGYAGIVPDLPGCIGDGDTAAEAVLDTRNAISEWLGTNASMGREAPLPGSAAEKMKKHDAALIETVRSALDVIEKQDGQILDLKRKIETISRLMQEDSSIPGKFSRISHGTKKVLPKNH